jgi:hypothetical protein
LGIQTKETRFAGAHRMPILQEGTMNNNSGKSEFNLKFAEYMYREELEQRMQRIEERIHQLDSALQTLLIELKVKR